MGLLIGLILGGVFGVSMMCMCTVAGNYDRAQEKLMYNRKGYIMKVLPIKIKYLRDIKEITPYELGDWIDLRAGETFYLEPGQTEIIPLGVAMELPEGYTAIIAPRSSTFAKWGIIQTNSIGVIDESYKGDNDEWCLPVLAFRKTVIHKNDRICQFRLLRKTTPVGFIKVKSLNNADRKGFGHSGKN